MISVSFSDFFQFVLIFGMLYLAALWFREEMRLKRNEWQLSNNHLFHCNHCHHSFIPKQPVTICRCPRCNTVCVRRRHDLFASAPPLGGRGKR